MTLSNLKNVAADCLVNGDLVSGSVRDDIINPGDLFDVVGSAPRLDSVAVDQAVVGAAATQPAWAALSAGERAQRVLAGAQAMADLPGLAEILTREQGKTLGEARGEVGAVPFFASYFAAKADLLDQGELRSNDPACIVRIWSEPVGVVAIITPHNWPVGITMAKVVPALIAGNSVVVKPAPTTPLALLIGLAAVAEHLPAGLLSVVTGGLDVPQALITHPRVRMVSFTGSTRTGALVAASAAGTIKNISLELGGNDPAILLDDVEVTPQLCQKLIASSFITAGQVCFALKRLYVPQDNIDDVVEGLGAVLDTFKVGPGLDPASSMGPLNNQAQKAVVERLLADAANRGIVRHFGELTVQERSGYFLRPALALGLGADAPLVSEEQFGPALPVIAYDSLDDAVAQANGTEYGLSASVWSPDEERAIGVARKLQAGCTAINAHGNVTLEAPFGGVKQSGIGRDLGTEGLLAFTEQQAVAVVR